MPNPTQSFMDALRDAIEAAWPDVVPNGVWETIDIREETFDDRGTPFAVMQPEPEAPDPEFSGISNDAVRVTVAIWRIQREEGGVDALRDALYTLRRALYDTPLGYGQFLWPVGVNTDGSNEANLILREKLQPFYGGSLRCEFTYGETAV